MPRKKAEAPATKGGSAQKAKTKKEILTERIKPYEFKAGDPRTIECAKKGGVAAAENKRKRKALREDLDYLLSLPEMDKRRLKRLTAAGIASDDAGLQMSMLYGLLTAAIKGDSKAAKVLVDILGEDNKPTDEGVQIIDDL